MDTKSGAMVDGKGNSENSTKGGNKHFLNRSWTLWYDSISTFDNQKWELSLVEVMTVRTIEDFFTMMHYSKPPHVLRVTAQYHFFREGVKPMWEDPSNKSGGKLWVVLDEKNVAELSSKKNDNDNSQSRNESKGKKEDQDGEKKPDLDTMWQNILMAMIGEYLDNTPQGDHVMGVVLSRRKYRNRLALWVRDASATDAIAAIEKNLIKEAGLPPSTKFIFASHGPGK